MTRKDYIVIAAALKAARAQCNGPAQFAQHAIDCNRIGDVLAHDNDRFNMHRFMTACGLGVTP